MGVTIIISGALIAYSYYGSRMKRFVLIIYFLVDNLVSFKGTAVLLLKGGQ